MRFIMIIDGDSILVCQSSQSIPLCFKFLNKFINGKYPAARLEFPTKVKAIAACAGPTTSSRKRFSLGHRQPSTRFTSPRLEPEPWHPPRGDVAPQGKSWRASRRSYSQMIRRGIAWHSVCFSSLSAKSTLKDLAESQQFSFPSRTTSHKNHHDGAATTQVRKRAGPAAR